jgi:hypothetical protein
MQGFIERSPAIKTRKRGKKKSGRDDANCLWAKSRVQRHRKHLMTFGDFHPDAIDAVNLIFACADPLISLEALINNNAAQNAVAAAAAAPLPPLTDAEIAEANEVFEDELDELGEGENDPDGEDDPEGEDDTENLGI